MKATYKLWRQAEGRGFFAEVAFLAVAKLEGVDPQYELQHEDGWRVVAVSDG